MAPQDFVNPYTFVPHAHAPKRGEPAWHRALEPGRLSGALQVRIRARTPLYVGGFTREGVHVLPARVDGTAMLPGSGLHGAVRAMHEALVGGCLRVVDTEYLPVHRQGAFKHVIDGVRLAVVTRVDDKGLPAEVAPCADTVWIDHTLLVDRVEAPFRTGDQLTVDLAAVEDDKGRRRLRKHRPGTANPSGLTRARTVGPVTDGTWVLLVTDTRPRHGRRVWFAAGQVGSPRLSVGEPARRNLAAAVRKADDRRPAHERDPETAGTRPVATEGFATVHWPVPDAQHPQSDCPVIGERLLVTDRLQVGQPVWVAINRSTGGAEEVGEVRLSRIWREVGSRPVGDRIMDGGPCRDPKKLCPSCRVFGSADPTGRDDDEQSRQLSYRGHVRFEDALVVGPVEPFPWDLAPLASPKPSAGQFYLDNSHLMDDARAAGTDARPLADWGSAADAGSPRTIRGRKFYWRTEPATAPEKRAAARGHRRGHHTDTAGAKTVQLFPSGTEFTTTVTFENLLPHEVGALAAAISPVRIWPDIDVVTSVGGGKPFGFGAVTATVGKVILESAKSRYLGEQDDLPVLDDCVAAFQEHARAVAGDAVVDQWPALRNALTLGFVADDLVWYPRGDGQRGTPEYDQGFDFWKASSGMTVKEKAGGDTTLEQRRLVSPPPATQDDQVLRLDVVRSRAKGRNR